MSSVGLERERRIEGHLRELCRIDRLGPRRYGLERVADDLGRLRRYLAASVVDADGNPGTLDVDAPILADRIESFAEHLEALYALECPTAAELVREGLTVDEALAEADRQRAAFRRRLGPRPRRKAP